jgi:hydroxymethylbilane synthase
MFPQTLRLGTRGSALARWQTDHVADLLRARWPGLQTEVCVIATRGDQQPETPLPLMGGKGVFTAEIEDALRRGEIDLAVHSLKDLPTTPTPGLVIGATTQRADAHDVLISRERYMLKTLPTGARVGTSSPRRRAQLLRARPDLDIADLRGNVDTRVRKALAGDEDYDAIVLAHAGLERLGRLDVVTQIFPFEIMLPAPGQGALAVQCRDEPQSALVMASIMHAPTQIAVTAERAFLTALEAGCWLPVAAYAEIEADHLHLRGRVIAPDGTAAIDLAAQVHLVGSEREQWMLASRIGADLATEALAQGARDLLSEV